LENGAADAVGTNLPTGAPPDQFQQRDIVYAKASSDNQTAALCCFLAEICTLSFPSIKQ
jgi:hypothetical protein